MTSECRRTHCRRRKGRGERGGERARRKEEKKKRWHQKTLTWLQGRRVKEAVQAPVPLLEPRDPSDSRSRSGMPSCSGLGILWLTIVLSVATTSWIYVSATMPLTSIAQAGGLKPDKSAHWTTVNGSSRSMDTDDYSRQ